MGNTMPRPGDAGGEPTALGRRSFLGAIGAAAGGLATSTAAARRAGDVDSGSPSRADGQRLAVDPRIEGTAFLLDPGVTVPVGLYPEAPLEPDDVVEDSLRLGPPAVVDDGGGAAAVDGGRDDELVYHFPAADIGLGLGDSRLKLVGRTVDGRTLVGTASLAPSGLGTLF